MIKKFLGLFGCKGESSPKKVTYKGEFGDIISFVDYVVRALVDDPSSVKINLTENEKKMNVINIYCQKADIGKIIGKSGKTIMAIRSLVTGAASRVNKQLTVEVVDNIAN